MVRRLSYVGRGGCVLLRGGCRRLRSYMTRYVGRGLSYWVRRLWSYMTLCLSYMRRRGWCRHGSLRVRRHRSIYAARAGFPGSYVRSRVRYLK